MAESSGGYLEPIVTIALAIVGVASLSVLVSRNSNTTGVIQSAGSAFSGSLATAMSPVTGTSGNSYVSTTFPIG